MKYTQNRKTREEDLHSIARLCILNNSFSEIVFISYTHSSRCVCTLLESGVCCGNVSLKSVAVIGYLRQETPPTRRLKRLP